MRFYEMINKEILNNIDYYNSIFKKPNPFRHVAIDNFLDEPSLNALCSEFPPFDNEKAKNEFGILGPKCVHTDIAAISKSYNIFDKHIRSADFINVIEKITGIEGLVIDRNMYGGGTHENINNAELDVHVDFNYDTETDYHRRLNLLLYLNEDWDEKWGGAIEIISNPLDFYNQDYSSQSYNCIKNRCLIFETNEYSWHGFKKINIPNEKAGASRKLISIYFYTKDRPEDEVVANHGTFYFPYPPELKGSLSYEEDVRLIKKRDMLLMSSYKKEIEQSQKILTLEKKITDIEKSLKPNYQGYVDISETNGFFLDGWVEKSCFIQFSCSEKIDSIYIDILNPQIKRGNIEIYLNDIKQVYEISKEAHKLEFKVQKLFNLNKLKIVSNIDSSVSSDERELSVLVSKILFK